MTTQVYYRKWRPGCFSDLAGQEHVAATLRQAIKQGRVSHSYLFCGPRGTGKTTTARIVAKAVNCLDPQDGDPCNQCAICRSINAERFMDTIEMDAASNRGIEDIREIRDKVNFAPAEGRRKVYIIDEAHMLTDQASNAFLKTLEEPPAHVIFILCTTEANRILPTIVSRCQRFDFRRLPAERIYQRLTEITDGEGVAVAPDARRLVARYAAGSLRDAENLLEQLVVSYGDGVTLDQVEELLGLGHSDRWLDLVNYLLTGNTAGALAVVNQAAWDGADLRQLHRQSLELLRAAMLLEWNAAGALELPEHATQQLQELVAALPQWRIIRALRTWGEVNMRYDAPSTLPLELAVVEICNADAAPPPPAAAPPPETAGRPAAPPRRANANPPPAGGRAPAAANSSPSAPAATAAPAAASFPAQWQATVKALGRCKGKKFNLGALLRDCKPDTITLNGDTITLPFAHSANFDRMQEELQDPNSRQMIADAIARCFDAPYKIEAVLAGGPKAESAPASRPNQHSPLVRTALNMGARILEDTVDEP